MLDIDYCNGVSCSSKNICQRYTDFLFRVQHKLDTRYAKYGVSNDCSQFKHKAFVGD